MATTITLTGTLEDLFRAAAQREGVSIEALAERRLEESELLWRIQTAAPSSETREFHRLLRLQRNGALTELDRETLLELIDRRERRAAQRMEDLAALARLRRISVRELMDQLGIRPIATP